MLHARAAPERRDRGDVCPYVRARARCLRCACYANHAGRPPATRSSVSVSLGGFSFFTHISGAAACRGRERRSFSFAVGGCYVRTDILWQYRATYETLETARRQRSS